MKEDSAQPNTHFPSIQLVRSIFCVHCKLGCFLALFLLLACVPTYLDLLIYYLSFFFLMCKNLCLYHLFSLQFHLSLYGYIFQHISLLLCVCVCVHAHDKYMFNMPYFATCPFSFLVSIRNLGQSYNAVFIWVGAMSLEDNQNSESGKYSSN